MPSTANGTSASPADDPSLKGLETRYVTRKLSELKQLEKNAHFVPAAKYNRLVANLRRDKVLTSTPLIYRDVIQSGNHRVRAALEAGITEATCQEILTELSHERLVAIQLSHNSLVGDDDPSALRELYDELPLDEKLYSGLTDDIFNDAPVDIASLGAVAAQYEEVKLLFLPEEREVFMDLVKQVEKSGKARPLTLVAQLSTFDELFNAIVGVKQQLNVHNTAMALKVVARLAVERLRQLEAAAETPQPD